uniref:Putative solute carrier family 17 n=1 Tax=Ixodes ricinus TaxID=34613 RepID=V5ID38_IXORI
MLMLFSGCLYLYAARMAMPITVTVISGQTGWNKTTAGVVLCCFFWGYALTHGAGGLPGRTSWGGGQGGCWALPWAGPCSPSTPPRPPAGTWPPCWSCASSSAHSRGSTFRPCRAS